MDFNEIALKYVKSKFKRTRKFIKEKVFPLLSDKSRVIDDKEKLKLWKEYQEVIKDKLEPEFKLSDSNKSKMVYYDGKPTFKSTGCFD